MRSSEDSGRQLEAASGGGDKGLALTYRVGAQQCTHGAE